MEHTLTLADMQHSNLYTPDMLDNLDQAGAEALVGLTKAADRQSRQFYGDGCEEEKLTRNAYRMGNIAIINELWVSRHDGPTLSRPNIRFALEYAPNLETIIRVFSLWSIVAHTGWGEPTFEEMIGLVNKNKGCKKEAIRFIVDVNVRVGNISRWGDKKNKRLQNMLAKGTLPTTRKAGV